MVGNRVHGWGVIGLMVASLSTLASAQRGDVAAGVAERSATVTTHVTIDVDNVPLGSVLQTIAHQAGLTPAYNSRMIVAQTYVTVHVRDVPVADAFRVALRGTGLVAVMRGTGNVTISRTTDVTNSVIVGTVIDATTKRPLRGAKIGLDAVDRVAETRDDGTFRISDVNTGPHTVTVKLLGYAHTARSVTVPPEGTITVDVGLTPSASALDQVVVTGTVIATELKAVPNAITVITAKDIEQRGITHIDQLFRGDVPGLFAQNSGSFSPLGQVTMFSRGGTTFQMFNDVAATNPIKTYVDGVEMADPSYLSQIDPRSIERIEILTGPQASTVYGSNALNGVMQIFTKRGGTVRPQLTANLLSGLVQNNFGSALTPQHDYSAQITGTEGRWGYNAGGSWNYMGPWTPAMQTQRMSEFGGGRMQFGVVTVDASLRLGNTQNHVRGADTPLSTERRANGFYSLSALNGLAAPQRYTLNGQTLGLTIEYAPTSWWSHELVIGTDLSDTEQRYTGVGHSSRSDTLLYLAQSHSERTSQRYAMTVRAPLTSAAHAVVTVGADAWQSMMTDLGVNTTTLTGALPGGADIARQPGHNAGGFVQGQVAVSDALFFTYGLRAEWNPDYGKEAQPNLAPRYGVAYTHDLGPVTAKLRASYGRSTRPPETGERDAVPTTSAATDYARFDGILANPDLGPEFQQGGEGGLELYLGNRASLVVTRYNQTVDALISEVTIDSVRSLVPNPASYTGVLDADGYGYLHQSEYLNVGSIRNQGWELQGTANAGPFTTKGTYSWTKSRVLGVTPKYRGVLFGTQYTVGAPLKFLPEHTWAFTVAYAHTANMLSLTVNGTGMLYNYFGSFYFDVVTSSIRLQSNRARINTSSYANMGAGYATTDLNATHRFSSLIEGVLQVQNLTNYYQNDFETDYASLGRQTKAGVRVRF